MPSYKITNLVKLNTINKFYIKLATIKNIYFTMRRLK